MPDSSTFHFGIQNEWQLKLEDVAKVESVATPASSVLASLELSKSKTSGNQTYYAFCQESNIDSKK